MDSLFIIDDFIKPYFIKYDGKSFEVIENKKTPLKGFENKRKNMLKEGEFRIYEKTVSYHTKLEAALKKITELKYVSQTKRIVLGQFIKSIKKEVRGIKTFYNDYL